MGKKIVSEDQAQLDAFFPPSGRCWVCGHPDARHRIWDAIMDRDEPDEEVARDYGFTVAAVDLVRRVRPYREEAGDE